MAASQENATKLSTSSALLALVLVAGCNRVAVDPNDPKNSAQVSAEQLQLGMKNAYDRTRTMISTKQLTEEKADEIFKTYVQDMVKNLDVSKLVEEDMWRYGEIFRTAERWDLAVRALEIASRTAKNEDRRVNDTLRYAQALAHNKQVTEAIAAARSTFTTNSENKAPILMAVYLEIVPAGRGQGQDLELAKLIRDAVKQHEAAKVDPESVPGRMFLIARPKHIRDATRLANDLATGTFGSERGVGA